MREARILNIDDIEAAVTIPALPPECRELFQEADTVWERYSHHRDFVRYVAADYDAVFRSLAALRGRVSTVLEWGSGLGVVTIMARLLGFEAYGIEYAPSLVKCSREFAQRFAPDAVFVEGSFIPSDYVFDPAFGDSLFQSEVDVESGYEELEMELSDFDLVYAFPWPDEINFLNHVMAQCSGTQTLFLTYDATEGMILREFNSEEGGGADDEGALSRTDGVEAERDAIDAYFLRDNDDPYGDDGAFDDDDALGEMSEEHADGEERGGRAGQEHKAYREAVSDHEDAGEF